MILRSLSAAAVLVAMTACVTSTVRTRFDTSADFTSYRTFAFLQPDPFIAAPDGLNPIVLPRIVSATQSMLESKGLSFLDEMDTADLIVSFTFGAREESNMSVNSAFYGRRSIDSGSIELGYPFLPQVTIKNYSEGTLAIDIADKMNGAHVWHGRKIKTFTEKMRKHPEKTVDEVVAEILQSYPPRN